VSGVPGLVSSVKVALTQMDDPNWGRRRHIREGSRQPFGGVWVGHSMNALL